LADAFLQTAIQTLRSAGVPDPEWDGAELLEWAGGPDRAHLPLWDGRLSEEAQARFQEGVRLRAARIPLQQIIGRCWFMGLPFKINREVLCPRPDTEILCERALKILKDREGRPSVLDLCCGSGCIGLSLAKLHPEARVILSDISPGALALARENAALNGVEERCEFVQGDMLAPFTETSFDLIVCNPPYIPSGEIEELMPEVRDHEPRLALDGGADGLEFYRRLASPCPPPDEGEGAAKRREGATCPHLLLEIGCEQGEAVKALFLKAGWKKVLVHKDYAGLDRVVEVIEE